jgi:exoribonuclease R
MEAEFISDAALNVFSAENGVDESPANSADKSRAQLLRALQKVTVSSSAEQSAQPARHVPLGLELYSRVTSPLRRYADFITHYQLKAYLRGIVVFCKLLIIFSSLDLFLCFCFHSFLI